MVWLALDLSTLDLTVGSLIRSGSGLLYAAAGLFILLVKPRRATNVWLGLFLLAWGLRFPARNIGYTFSPLLITAALLQLLAAAVLAQRILHLVRELPPRSRKLVFVAALVCALAIASIAALLAGQADRFVSIREQTGVAPALAVTEFVSFVAASFTLVVWSVVASERARHSRNRAAPAELLAAFGLVIWTVQSHASDFANYLTGAPSLSPVYGILLVGGVLASFAFLRAAVAPHIALARVASWTTLALGVAGAILGALGLSGVRDLGINGILRTAGFAFVLYAIFRLDLLGVPLTKRRLRVGTLASVGLAALFITAQVAQNFLSDSFGLLIGGVVAGTVVFAAFPLQKAAERAVERRKRQENGLDSPAAKYRRLVETAWQDGKLGANERLMLSESMTLLGVDAESAHRVDDDVARSHTQSKRRPA